MPFIESKKICIKLFEFIEKRLTGRIRHLDAPM